MIETIKTMLKKREWSIAIDIDKGDEVGVVEFHGNVFKAILWTIRASKLR